MLAKLLKYDFRSLKRFGVPIIIALLVATVLGTINMLTLVYQIEKMTTDDAMFLRTLITTASSVMMVLIFVAIAAAVTGMQVLICVDFYKSLVSDEGYLTFTLPVKAQDILRSKLINASLWSFIIGGASILAMGIMIAAGIIPMVGWRGFLDILESIVMLDWSAFFANWEWEAVLLLLLGGLLALISFVNTQLLYFAAIFFASVIARKHKVLAAIGCVYGVNMIYSLFSGIAMPIISVFSSIVGIGTDNPLLVMNLTLLIGCILLTGLNILFYYLTKYMMEKKLNLA